jgi:enhancing lycopene biosynthesis protein 2
MARVAVILAGCGYLDGAEIRESVLSLLYLDQLSCDVECFAPDIIQYHVVDHLTKTEANESRNVLHEAARIARSSVRPLSELNEKDFDALVLPGGFGVAKNLSSLAFKGNDAELLQEYACAIQAFYGAKKPIGAICIAPAVVALALKNQGISLTIGEDVGTAEIITASGNIHVNAATDMAVVDTQHAVVSCSAYMRDDKLSRVAEGIEKCVRAVIALCSKGAQRKAS